MQRRETSALVPGRIFFNRIFRQAIGRWGNFINQEVYGSPTDLPWAITIDEQHRLLEFMEYSTYHPLFYTIAV